MSKKIITEVVNKVTNLFIVANWKSNKTEKEAIEWLQQLSTFNSSSINKGVIICPPFTLLPILRSYIINHKSAIKLGAQNISPFNEGSYTGEINGRQIKEFADFVLIGHSERREYFNEEDKVVNKKLEMALKYGLIPILCISNIDQIHNSEFIIHNSEIIVAYEPLGSIGTGSPDSPEHAKNIAIDIKNKFDNAKVLYGGSVNPNNIKNFMSVSDLDGVLIGKESLDAGEFLRILANAQ